MTATERSTGLAKQVVIDNMMERFRHRERVDALERIDALFADSSVSGGIEEADVNSMANARFPCPNPSTQNCRE